jgi:syntaxin-binding protein 5
MFPLTFAAYSSILLHVGTNVGNLATFKILPENSGRYSVQIAGVINVEDSVVQISPISADTGNPAYASQHAVADLRNGRKVNGILVVVTSSGVKMFKPATGRGASKSFDQFVCRSAFLSRCADRGQALVLLASDGTVRAYTIPGLREIASRSLPVQLDLHTLNEAVITATGDILAWKGPAEVALLNVWGNGLDL